MIKTVQCDVLVVGGGMAAMMVAVEAAGKGANTVLVDKGTLMESGSSPQSLYGLAATIAPEDSPELLFKDIVADGYGLSEQNLAWEAAQGAAENYRFLENIGMRFMRGSDGKPYLYHGVGHSVRRGVTQDRRGQGAHPVAVVGAEARRRGAKLYDSIMITKILGSKDGVTGAVGVSRDGVFHLFEAKTVVIAAGGANNLYPNACENIRDPEYWTTGDAFALAFDLGVPLVDMEFSNFREGKALYASRIGGFLVNAQGERFMSKYDSRLERAPRGKLVEAMYIETRQGRGPIYHQHPDPIRKEAIEQDYTTADMAGKRVLCEIDYQRLLGGILINERAETSMKGLFAAGESQGGFHGADRMQGASFLECTIFGGRTGRNAAEYASKTEVEFNPIQAKEEIDRLREIQDRKGGSDPSRVLEVVRDTMWEHCSIVKEARGLKKALETITELRENNPLSGNLFAALTGANLALTAEMCIRASLVREETRGTHRRGDFPKQDDAIWLKHVAIENRNGKVVTTTLPITRVKK